MKRKIAWACIAGLVLTGCGNAVAQTEESSQTTQTVSTAQTSSAVTTVSLTTGEYSDKAIAAEWDEATATQITLDGSDISIEGNGVTEENKTLTITSAGTYVFEGSLTDGQIVVEAGDEENVQIVLNGADITNSSQAAIYVKNAKNVYLTLAEGTENAVTDGSEYEAAKDGEEITAAIYSKSDLFINGSGSLTVNANYNDGITSKDDLKIIDGTIQITATDDGIVGKDSVCVRSGNITISAGGDGIKSTNAEDTSKGYIIFDGGTFDITSGGDGVQAETSLIVNDGSYHIVTNGGSANASYSTSGQMNEKWGQKGAMGGGMGRGGYMPNGEEAADGTMPEEAANRTMPEEVANGTVPEEVANGTVPEEATDKTMPETPADDDSEETTVSAKGLKGVAALTINGGNLTIDSSDDSLHSNGDMTVSGGILEMSSGDDGMHSDSSLVIEGGTIDIAKSYEGIESYNITINGGDIQVTSNDDGLNVCGGNDGSSVDGRAGQNSFDADNGGLLTIAGGSLIVNATGDGLDSNGSIAMTGGDVTVYGPTDSANGALDYSGTFDISGGNLFVSGSSGMAQSPSDSSEQGFVASALGSSIAAGTEIVVTDASGTEVASFISEKSFDYVCVSNDTIQDGETYTITAGSSSVEATAGEATTGTMGGGGFQKQRT